MTYQEQLEDPRWQEKRREILQRDNFKCVIPGCCSTINLQVHHKQYLKGKMAWEHPSDLLSTLCNKHHQALHGKHTSNGKVKFLANRKQYYKNMYTKVANSLLRIQEIK